jgi:ribulose-5-phosphate 4-epimerase/fuculose-1-phosphate aldolase
LALFARALYREGYDDANIGHVTYQQGDELLILPLTLGWDEVRASDVLSIRPDGAKTDGDGHVPPAIILHLEVRRRRPDVVVTLHQHPLYSTAWSALGRIPPVYDQRSVMDVERVALYDDCPGSVSDQPTAAAAAEGIGDADIALLRNHGVFIVGESIGQAFCRASSLERRSKLALHVESVGAGRELPSYGQDQIRAHMQSMSGQAPGYWEWAIRRELRHDPDVLS